MTAFTGYTYWPPGCYDVGYCPEPDCYTKVSWNDGNGKFYYEPCNCKPKPEPKIKKTGKSKYF